MNRVEKERMMKGISRSEETDEGLWEEDPRQRWRYSDDRSLSIRGGEKVYMGQQELEHCGLIIRKQCSAVTWSSIQ